MIISDLDFMEKVTVENERVNGGSLVFGYSDAFARVGRNIGKSRNLSFARGPSGFDILAETSSSASADEYSSSATGSSRASVTPSE